MNKRKEDLEKERSKVIKELVNCNVKLFELQNKLTQIEQTIWELKHYPNLFEEVRKVEIVNMEDKKNDM